MHGATAATRSAPRSCLDRHKLFPSRSGNPKYRHPGTSDLSYRCRHVAIGGVARTNWRNARFAATGSFAAAGLVGLLGYSFRTSSFATAEFSIPTLDALGRIRGVEIHLKPGR